LSKREDKFTSLFVRGLPDGCDDEGLKKLFEEYVSREESILSLKVQTDSEGKLCDYGYITFSNHKDAQAA
jgi:RNA recognition motif-containing protein